MKLTIIATGSSGNCYLFENKDTAFIIDAGVNLRKALPYINDIKNLKGLFLTHEHIDHSKFFGSYTKMGVPLYTSKGTATALGISESRYNRIKQSDMITIGSVKIVPFNVVHNAHEPLGFLIYSNNVRTLFATDCNKIPVNVRMVDNYIIEANHCTSLMEGSFVDKQAYNNHMSIDSSIDFINEQREGDVKQVVLIHLSERNANSDYFKTKMEEATGIPTIVATKDKIIKL